VLEWRKSRNRESVFRCAQAVEDKDSLWKEKEKSAESIASTRKRFVSFVILRALSGLLLFLKPPTARSNTKGKKTKGAIACALQELLLSLLEPALSESQRVFPWRV
jgi:hypothetical protein